MTYITSLQPRHTSRQMSWEGEGPSALLFNYFTTPALRYAVMMVIPQIKVCGFYSPSPPLSHSHTLLIDGLQPLAAVMWSSEAFTVSDSCDDDNNVNVLCLLTVHMHCTCVLQQHSPLKARL